VTEAPPAHQSDGSAAISGIKGQVALVTAAAGRGVGQAIARRLAADGATVVVTDIHPGRTQKVVSDIGADYPGCTIVGYPMDAGDRDQIDTVVDAVSGSLGPIQILVNNAAVNVMGSIFDYDPADWDWCVRVNLSGPWYLCRRIMPLMREAAGGVVINIGTYAADVGGYGLETPYAVTKGGLNALTRASAHEGAPFGIRSNCISIGLVRDTKFVDDHPEVLAMPQVQALMDLPSTSEVAELAAYLASPRSRPITGEIINMAAGAYMRN
jgi:3-oxoacyl-[acyl-carrier protein] reductase